MERSSNCSTYTDNVSLLVDASAFVPGDSSRCRVRLPPTFSCQKSAFETPDEATKEKLRELARPMLEERGCDASNMELEWETNIVGTRRIEYSAERLASLGMASNCYREGNDPNHATHVATAHCRPMYDMTDEQGRRVRDVNRVFLSSLATCDVSSEAMPQLMEDARKVAAHNAASSGLTLDQPEDLACQISVLPHL